MLADDLKQMLRVRPFRPFRIFLSSGNSYLVPDPEWMLVTTFTTAIGVPGQSGDGDRLAILDNSSITEAQPADPLPSR